MGFLYSLSVPKFSLSSKGVIYVSVLSQEIPCYQVFLLFLAWFFNTCIAPFGLSKFVTSVNGNGNIWTRVFLRPSVCLFAFEYYVMPCVGSRVCVEFRCYVMRCVGSRVYIMFEYYVMRCVGSRACFEFPYYVMRCVCVGSRVGLEL